ncbi:efflux RND transporter periplasmic adaptor subunit [Methyloradius palustris]|uniref:Uncharacterized protein n=1 Tax=Methyloradius palustris TaxID=2778876 RepID=A0A8D5GE26_9PROT|nr:efflux RND transporter periplasmic adaptor subunit [Methyloradius palustris]BCM24939.1 hypothetical protein ZMTM_11980 [Methyloradius palustris]
MNRKIALIIGLQAFIIILMFWVIVFYGKDEYEAYSRDQQEEIETPNRVSAESGVTVVTLSPDTQKQSDITTSTPKASKHQATLTALGTVVNLDTLIELRSRYFAATADAELARASLINSQQEYKRLAKLNEDNHNISDRAVIASEALYKADQAKLAAAENAANNIRDTIRQGWGETLTLEATAQPAKPLFQGLLSYQEVLVQVTLPFSAALPKAGSTINITPTGTQTKSIVASFVSVSPTTDNSSLGKTFYYRAAADDLRAGMRIKVDLAENSHLSGVLIPKSAVVWYGGKAWVYKKIDSDHFSRQPVSADTETDDGWFNPAGVTSITAQDEIVVNGAQLLLSEEFKYQIKNENGD